MAEKIIYSTERGAGGRYRVDYIRDIGGWRWDVDTRVDDKSVAKAIANSLVKVYDYAEARVVDTKAEEES